MVLYESRQDALNHMREALRDIAPIAARDIERNFELYELSLQAVVDGLKDPAVMALCPDCAERSCSIVRPAQNISGHCSFSMQEAISFLALVAMWHARVISRTRVFHGPTRQPGSRRIGDRRKDSPRHMPSRHRTRRQRARMLDGKYRRSKLHTTERRRRDRDHHGSRQITAPGSRLGRQTVRSGLP